MTTHQRAEITTMAIKLFSQNDDKYNGFIQGAEAMDELYSKDEYKKSVIELAKECLRLKELLKKEFYKPKLEADHISWQQFAMANNL